VLRHSRFGSRGVPAAAWEVIDIMVLDSLLQKDKGGE
jgi:hypothetical protein